jgi:hypothetical protein
MVWRMVFLATVIAVAMIAIKDGRVLREVGLTGSCSQVSAEHVFWEACTRGKLDGRPDLSRQGCKAVAIRGKVEWWRCPAGIGSSRGT